MLCFALNHAQVLQLLWSMALLNHAGQTDAAMHNLWVLLMGALLDAMLPGCNQQAWQQLGQHTCMHGSQSQLALPLSRSTAPWQDLEFH